MHNENKHKIYSAMWSSIFFFYSTLHCKIQNVESHYFEKLFRRCAYATGDQLLLN